MSNQIDLSLTHTTQAFNFHLTNSFLKIRVGSILLSSCSFPKTQTLASIVSSNQKDRLIIGLQPINIVSQDETKKCHLMAEIEKLITI